MKITHCKLKKKNRNNCSVFCTGSYRPFCRRYFGHSAQFRYFVLPQNPKGRHSRGAAGKVVVFGILKRNGRVYTVMVDNAKSESLLLVIKKKIMPDSIVYTDSLGSYDKLDVSGFIHHRINHSKEFADHRNHINGIENFWNQAKRVLRKYNGIDRKSFPLFLKECEFRFNFGTPSRQLKILQKWCEI